MCWKKRLNPITLEKACLKGRGSTFKTAACAKRGGGRMPVRKLPDRVRRKGAPREKSSSPSLQEEGEGVVEAHHSAMGKKGPSSEESGCYRDSGRGFSGEKKARSGPP